MLPTETSSQLVLHFDRMKRLPAFQWLFCYIISSQTAGKLMETTSQNLWLTSMLLTTLNLVLWTPGFGLWPSTMLCDLALDPDLVLRFVIRLWHLGIGSAFSELLILDWLIRLCCWNPRERDTAQEMNAIVQSLVPFFSYKAYRFFFYC